MYIRTTYGPVWVSDEPPYYRNWQGSQFYRFNIAEPRCRQHARQRSSSARDPLAGGR